MESEPIISQPYYDLAAALSEEVTNDVEAGKIDGKGIKNDPREKLRLLGLRKAAQLNRRKQLEDVLSLAGDFLAARTLDFDRDPMVLNLTNGTFDLRNSHFRKHEPRDLLRKRMQVEYRPNADCPLWKTFISTLFGGDLPTVEFVRRALGYSLTGRVDHDFIIFCYGGGSNGKSTMFEVLRMLFGDYFVHLPIEALLSQGRAQRDSHASAELVRLAAARFALASEIPSGRTLNESLIKDLSGGGVLTARSLYRDPITFETTHKLWLMGNHKPEIQGQDAGIWRRIHLVPFQHQFPKSGQVGYRKRSDVVRELLGESSGILNWLLDGLRDLDVNGLNPPAAVQSATDDYRSESDLLEDFINRCCTLGPGLSCSTRDLWEAYRGHCAGETQAYTSQRKLTTALEERGFRQKRTNSSRQLEGITINDII
jgi:putative DNA primase/helicase